MAKSNHHLAVGLVAVVIASLIAVACTPQQAAPQGPNIPMVVITPVAGEKREVTLVKVVRTTLVNTNDALKKGDIAGARAAFKAYNADWNGIEIYIQFRSRDLYGQIETDLEAKVQKLLDAPQPNAAEIIPALEALMAKYDEAIKLVSTGPAISPLFDDVGALRIVRAPLLRYTGSALTAGDLATAKASFAKFKDNWGSVEALISVRSADADRDIVIALDKASAAMQQEKPDAAALSPLVAALLARYNFGVSLVTAAARNADLTKTTYTTADVQSAADVAAIAVELKASQALWEGKYYQEAGDHARRASGDLFNKVSVALAAKSADTALKTALDAYTALSDKNGDVSKVRAANQTAIDAVAVAQQALVGQFWADPKLKDAIAAAGR